MTTPTTFTLYGELSLSVTVAPTNSASGQVVRVTAVVKDQSGRLVAPATLTLTISVPDNSTTSLTIDQWALDTYGIYHLDYVASSSLAGTYQLEGVTTVPNARDVASFSLDSAPASGAWIPAVSDVAALLAQRTIDATGLPTGTFSTTTVPTAAQVTALITDIAAEVAATVGTVPVSLYQDAKLATALGTAWLIEAAFDEGTGQMGQLLNARYQQALTRLSSTTDEVSGLWWGVR